MEIEEKDYKWLINYIKKFHDWDVLGYFITPKNIVEFNKIKEKYN